MSAAKHHCTRAPWKTVFNLSPFTVGMPTFSLSIAVSCAQRLPVDVADRTGGVGSRAVRWRHSTSPASLPGYQDCYWAHCQADTLRFHITATFSCFIFSTAAQRLWWSDKNLARPPEGSAFSPLFTASCWAWCSVGPPTYSEGAKHQAVVETLDSTLLGVWSLTRERFQCPLVTSQKDYLHVFQGCWFW